jgi:hypothetical protein
MRYPSIDSTSPRTSHPEGARKIYGKSAGRSSHVRRPFVPMPVLTLNELPPTPPPSTVVRVGTRVTGSFCCPACRTRTTSLVRQLPGSTHPWVCNDWCSPRDPRRGPFISTEATNAGIASR